MPRKTLKEQKSKNRILPLLKNLIGTEKPDDLMNSILSVLTESSSSPKIGNSYTFIYYKKTPNLIYDQHPLVKVSSIETWGFRGFNYHWNKIKQYTWNEMVSGLYEINEMELISLRKIPYGKIIKN